MNKEIAMMIICQQIFNSEDGEISYSLDGDDLKYKIAVKDTPKVVLEELETITSIKIKLGADICVIPTVEN